MGEHKHNQNALLAHDMKLKPRSEQQNLTMQYGHTGEQVVVIFNRAIENVTLTEEQVDAMISCLTEAKKGLIEHKARVAIREAN